MLGSRADPWKMRAVLQQIGVGGDSNAVLVGETICGFKEGACTFETLGISHSGDNYEIRKADVQNVVLNNNILFIFAY